MENKCFQRGCFINGYDHFNYAAICWCNWEVMGFTVVQNEKSVGEVYPGNGDGFAHTSTRHHKTLFANQNMDLKRSCG